MSMPGVQVLGRRRRIDGGWISVWEDRLVFILSAREGTRQGIGCIDTSSQQ